MSYDVSLYVGEDELYWRNHTSNTSRMWREAGCDLAMFEGKTAAELHESLRHAIANLMANASHYRQYEPENKWGSFNSTLEFLTSIAEACGDHPTATVRVSA